jgi:hypothetical protein
MLNFYSEAAPASYLTLFINSTTHLHVLHCMAHWCSTSGRNLSLFVYCYRPLTQEEKHHGDSLNKCLYHYIFLLEKGYKFTLHFLMSNKITLLRVDSPHHNMFALSNYVFHALSKRSPTTMTNEHTKNGKATYVFISSLVSDLLKMARASI